MNLKMVKIVDDEYNRVACDILTRFEEDKKNGIETKKWNLIPSQQYSSLLTRYMSMGEEMARIPKDVVSRWFEDVIIKNTTEIKGINRLIGSFSQVTLELVENFYGIDIVKDESRVTEFTKRAKARNFLKKRGFYKWCKFPDGTYAWSDFGIKPLLKIISEYNINLSGAEILILINRAIHVAHYRGDLASAFIEGGSKTCNIITNS